MKHTFTMAAFGAAMLVPVASGAVVPPVAHAITPPVSHAATHPVTHIVTPPLVHATPRAHVMSSHPMRLATAVPSRPPCLHSGCQPVPAPTVVRK